MVMLSRCKWENREEHCLRGRRMKARAIKFSLETRHVLPRVWRGGHGWSRPRDRRYRALRDKSVALLPATLTRDSLIIPLLYLYIHTYIYICAIPLIIVCINLLDLEKSYNFILRPANKHILISETTSLSKNPFDNSKLSPNSIDPFTEGVSNIDDSTLSNSLKNFVDLIYIWILMILPF